MFSLTCCGTKMLNWNWSSILIIEIYFRYLNWFDELMFRKNSIQHKKLKAETFSWIHNKKVFYSNFEILINPLNQKGIDKERIFLSFYVHPLTTNSGIPKNIDCPNSNQYHLVVNFFNNSRINDMIDNSEWNRVIWRVLLELNILGTNAGKQQS
jgi:hypothetical protein